MLHRNNYNPVAILLHVYFNNPEERCGAPYMDLKGEKTQLKSEKILGIVDAVFL